MKTNVRRSSIDAYRELDLSKRELEILEVIIVYGSSTIREIAARKNLIPSSCTGALNSLQERRVIHMSKHRRLDRVSGNQNHEWILGPAPDDQLPLIEAIQQSFLDERSA